MLDTATKKRIDDCRDILVGKLPDPKAQIEQITIGLIYKFMDDMDKEAIEMGGKAKFFSGNFKKYSWDSLFDTKVTAIEMLGLYSEAITSMDKNPNIPQLFRDIFKNAFLPYRDPETLKLFLKTIGEFEYTHSEKLGDAFEYLLSVMGSQGDAGQFRTPRHIIDFMVAVVDPGKTDTILDPACGTAGFLISAFKYIKEKSEHASTTLSMTHESEHASTSLSMTHESEHASTSLSMTHESEQASTTLSMTKEDEVEESSTPLSMTKEDEVEESSTPLGLTKVSQHSGHTSTALSLTKEGESARGGQSERSGQAERSRSLTPDERKKLIQNFTGYDISPDMVRLSLVNLYLHGFSDPHIWEYDTLSSEDRWNESFDVILANPPFMSPKGGIRPHKKFSISSNRSEVLFVDYIAEHLNPKGRAGIIVPEGVIFQSGTAYKDLRKMLVENYLYAVVSLPAGIFNPYSGVKTSILLMDKQIAKTCNEILFVKIDNDGFNLGAQRNAVKGGQLDYAIEIIRQFKAGIFDEDIMEESSTPLGLTIADQPGGQIKQSSHAERNSHAERSRSIAHAVSKSEISKNGDYNLSGERYKTNKIYSSVYPFVELIEIIKLSSGNGLTSINMKDGDFPVYGGNGIAGWHSEYFVEKPTIVIGRVGAYCGSIHITKTCSWITDNGLYVTEYLRNDVNQTFLALMLKELNLNRFAKVGGQPSISQSTVKEQKIPFPPLSVQEEIVSEIEAYQKIIDGAKMVVANYKPKIDIDPEWEMVELGGLAKNLDGKRVPITKSVRVEGKYPYYGASGIVDYVVDYIFDDDLLLISEDGANLLARVTPIAFSVSGKVWVNNHAHVLKFENIESQKYVELYLNSISLANYITGSAQPKLNQKALNSIMIPFPSFDTQNQIVAQIEKEQELVNANKQLIELFEQKIKDRIAKVWGE